jgi:hypothetical protein
MMPTPFSVNSRMNYGNNDFSFPQLIKLKRLFSNRKCQWNTIDNEW